MYFEDLGITWSQNFRRAEGGGAAGPIIYQDYGGGHVPEQRS